MLWAKEACSKFYSNVIFKMWCNRCLVSGAPLVASGLSPTALSTQGLQAVHVHVKRSAAFPALSQVCLKTLATQT